MKQLHNKRPLSVRFTLSKGCPKIQVYITLHPNFISKSVNISQFIKQATFYDNRTCDRSSVFAGEIIADIPNVFTRILFWYCMKQIFILMSSELLKQKSPMLIYKCAQHIYLATYLNMFQHLWRLGVQECLLMNRLIIVFQKRPLVKLFRYCGLSSPL